MNGTLKIVVHKSKCMNYPVLDRLMDNSLSFVFKRYGFEPRPFLKSMFLSGFVIKVLSMCCFLDSFA